MPEMPAPTITTSRCSLMGQRYQHHVETVNVASRTSTCSKVAAMVTSALPAHAAQAPRGRRSSRPSGDDREAAILQTAERLLSERLLSEISVDDDRKSTRLNSSHVAIS